MRSCYAPVAVRGCIAVILLTAGCGPEAEERAALDEVCGHPSPFRVLETDDVDTLTSSSIHRIGEHVFVGRSTVYAFEPCGDAPRIVARDVAMLEEREPFTGVALACSGEKRQDIVLVDPLGTEPPRTVFTAPGCNGRWGKHGIIGVVRDEQHENNLVIQPYPDDLEGPPVGPVQLLGGVRDAGAETVALRDDELLIIDRDGDLIRVELPSGVASVEQAGVSVFALSPDARFLAFMDERGLVEMDALAQAHGDLHLRDRVTGEEMVVEGASMSWPLVLDMPGFAWLWLGVEPGVSTQVVDLATRSMHAIPGDRELWLVTVDGQWLTELRTGSFALRDVASGRETLLPNLDLHGDPNLWFVDETGLEVIDGTSADGPLLRLDFDGSPPEALARRVDLGYDKLADGRIVTRVDIDEVTRAGVLVVVEPSSLDEQIVDADVTHSIHVDLGSGFGDNAIMYAVDDGDRSGMWLARIGD